MKRVLPLSIAVVLAATPLSAQNAAGLFVGTWNCQHSMEPYSGNAYDKHFWQYQMNVGPNGSWEMAGMYYNPVIGEAPMRGGGNWAPQQATPTADFNGQFQRAGASVSPYTIVYELADANTMYVQFRGYTHMTNARCER